MPCYLVVSIEVKNEVAAREALNELGWSHFQLRKTATGFLIDMGESSRPMFLTQYAKAYAKAQARKNLYRFTSEERDKAGNLVLTFTR